MLKIVMDSAGDLPEGWAEQYDIQVIPINIHFEEQTYLQGIDLSDEQFYTTADNSPNVPKTSQPTPQQFIDFYRRIAELGDTILSLHVTSKLSGTFESAVVAARELKDQFNVLPFDSQCGSAAMGYMCREARTLERSGASLQSILERLEFISNHITIVLTLDTLEYARKSGRVKALQAALASLLNVKPIIVLQEGVLDMAEKVRTRQRALERVLQLVQEKVGNRMVNAAVVHARDPNSGEQLMEKVRGTLNCKDLIMTGLSIGVAANLGPGTVGVVAYPLEEDSN